MVIRWLLLAGLGISLAACSSASGPRPTPTAMPPGTLVGTVDGGCFGYCVPNRYPLTVTASQGGVAKGSTVITETNSDTTSGRYIMLGNEYRLTLSPGRYGLTVSGGHASSLNGHPGYLGVVTVRAGTTTTNPTHVVQPSC